MKTRMLAPLGLGALLAIGLVSALPGEAAAQSHQTCHMKGVWNGASADVFEFDAAYVYNRGEDDFTGIYTNPGVSQANISAAARSGTWNILLSYVDAAHKGWARKLVGKGVLDGTSHGILITGSYQQFLPGKSAADSVGTFVIDGKCK
jgi:hypothetical protein